jgi:hypothetical protein
VFIVTEQPILMNMSRSNDFIYDAVTKLESLIHTAIELDSKRKEYDAAITVNGNRLNVIAKSAIRDSNIEANFIRTQ